MGAAHSSLAHAHPCGDTCRAAHSWLDLFNATRAKAWVLKAVLKAWGVEAVGCCRRGVWKAWVLKAWVLKAWGVEGVGWKAWGVEGVGSEGAAWKDVST